MLVKLYDFPSAEADFRRLLAEGVTCRRAESYERSQVLAFVSDRWPNWRDEALACFSRVPPTIFIATRDGRVIGFAAFDATRPDYFGPTGVEESERRRGIGGVLLWQCLEALKAAGYAYAIIGAAGPTAFYERAANATAIPGSDPGIYRDRLRVGPA
ncbi:MAG: GNAT family N-acetyltransferase [Chloroflexi bacterium]|nr:GNAT family N-acetyltransferase [Chloroflexota bacterium]